VKKVLIITYYWPPAGGGGVQRWVKFARYLRLFGWEPVIYTVSNGDYPILDNTLQRELPDGLTVLKTPIREPYDIYRKLTGKKKDQKLDANFLSQGKKLTWKESIAVWIRGNFFIPDARMWWIKPSVTYLKNYLKEHPVDAMISTGPPHSCHMIALGLHKSVKIPWLVDYRDPWTQIDYFQDLNLTFFAKNRHLYLEKKVLRSCDRVITVGKTMAADLQQILPVKTAVITNGYDEDDVPQERMSLVSTFSITYIGTMNDARNPLGFWNAVSELKAEKHPVMSNIVVNLVGKPEDVVRTSVADYELQDVVHFTGYVTHADAIKYQNTSTILLLVINRTSNNKSILTGKIFEYLASGRPILCLGPEDGDAAEIIKEAQAGKVIDYDDVDGIKTFITKAYAEFLSDNKSAMNLSIEKYSRKYLTGQLAQLLDEITNTKKES
jgi:glycosyltransferase involved in cell wall biosynthesis